MSTTIEKPKPSRSGSNVCSDSGGAIKERPILFSGPLVQAILCGAKTETRRVVKQPKRKDGCKLVPELLQRIGVGKACPYGSVDDILWVRETWQSAAAMNQCHQADDYYIYRATDPDWESMDGWQWRPSIFMPRDACRLRLRITGLGIERLHDIDDDGAEAEGIQVFRGDGPRDEFAELWKLINGKDSWDINPWVWVIEFERFQ